MWISGESGSPDGCCFTDEVPDPHRTNYRFMASAINSIDRSRA